MIWLVSFAFICAMAYAAKCRRERDVARAQRTDALRRLDMVPIAKHWIEKNT